MRLGPYEIPDSPAGFVTALAPMAAVTDPPFRTLAREHGCGLTVTEMVSADALVQGGPGGEAACQLRMERAPNETFRVAQLFGGEPDVMAEAARRVEADGAHVVDVNMGCPVRKIACKHEAGVALMRDPPRAAAIVRAMTDAVRIPVTVKMRAGWDDQSVNAPEMAAVLEDAGAAMVAVHARTRDMVHTGQPRREIVRAVKARVKIPVLGNGGIHGVADARTMVDETGCDGVMIGRGAQGNPWVFASIDAGRTVVPDLDARFDAVLRHLELSVQHDPGRAVRVFRKHVCWYIAGLPGAARFRAGLGSLDTLARLRTALAEYREAVRSGRAAHEDTRGGAHA